MESVFFLRNYLPTVNVFLVYLFCFENVNKVLYIVYIRSLWKYLNNYFDELFLLILKQQNHTSWSPEP